MRITITTAVLGIMLAGPAVAVTPVEWSELVHAKTDAPTYEDGAIRADGTLGDAILINDMAQPVWLGGCNQFAYETQAADGSWSDIGGLIECFWEGYAVKIDGESTQYFSFRSPGPGTYRIRFDVSLGCQDGKPLSQSQCTAGGQIWSPPFVVQ